MNCRISSALVTTLALCCGAASAASLGTAFTYQGRLTTGTNAADGIFDFKFSLYDAVTSGGQVGSSVTNAATAVANGYFVATLDFGAAFDGNARWLETAVRTNGAASFVTLAPRQPLTAAPYATYAPGAGTASAVTAGAITSAMLADGAVTTAKIGTAAVKPANVDDGGSAAYESLFASAKGMGTTTPLPFNALAPVAADSLMTFRLNGALLGTVAGFIGHEALSEPYEFVVEVIVPRPDLDLQAQLGLPARVVFARGSRSTAFAGLVTGCSLASYDGASALYTFRVESPLALLALWSDYRVNQEVSVPDLAANLYHDAATNTLSLSLSGTYPQRESVIQLGETDLNFFSRLLEEEGIFYYFSLSGAPPTLILGDDSRACPTAPNSPFRYYGDLNTEVPLGSEFIRTFGKATHQSTFKSVLNSYDFKRPNLSLLAEAESPLGGFGERYNLGSYTVSSDGKGLAKLRQERNDVERMAMVGSSTVSDLRPGYRFTLDDRTESGLAGDYLVTSVRHAAFRRVTNGVANLYYGNQFEVIPTSQPFRPALKSFKPIASACSAVVTGPATEEIHTDADGRVKVQFHWDRYGAKDENSSAWMRVASPWAGSGWGMMFIPRIGQEVMVEFVNGDPDQPVITGSFYNGNHVPPYALPAEKTKSTIKSQSSKGGGGANEIRFEDLKGSEEVYVHAQKDFNHEVENDMTSSVGRDLTSGVSHDMKSTVNHDLTLSVGNNLTATADASLKSTAGTTMSLLAGGNMTLKAGGSMTLDSANKLTLTAPGGIGLNTGSDPAFALKVGGAVSATNFQGNGSGLTSVNADMLDGQHGAFYQNAGNLNAGTLLDARLSLNVPRLDGSQSFSGNNAFLGRVSIGGAMNLDTLTVYGTARLNDFDLFLRPNGDLNHGLGWYGSSKLFGGVNVDGPVLYGCDGGGLGSGCNSTLALRWRNDGNVMIDPASANAGALLPGLTFGSFSGEGISSKRTTGGNQFGLDFYTYGTNRLSITQTGNVGIGKSNPTVALDVVGTIRVTGAIRCGSETGAAAPGLPAGSDGLVIRRVSSTSSSSNSIVARTDVLTLIRDGTASGLRLAYPAAPGKQTICCLGVTTNGAQVVYRNALNNPVSAGSLPLFNDAQKVVHYDISFGNPYNSAHTTHVVLDRYDDGTTSDNYLVGTITSTYNQ